MEGEERANMRKKMRREQTITGIVVPDDWDEQDNVIRVAIRGPLHEEYVVEYNKQGKELLSLTDRKVRVTGKIRERLSGEVVLSVNSYEVIPETQDV